MKALLPSVLSALQQVHFFDHESRYVYGASWYFRRWPRTAHATAAASIRWRDGPATQTIFDTRSQPSSPEPLGVDGSGTYLHSTDAAVCLICCCLGTCPDHTTPHVPRCVCSICARSAPLTRSLLSNYSSVLLPYFNRRPPRCLSCCGTLPCVQPGGGASCSAAQNTHARRRHSKCVCLPRQRLLSVALRTQCVTLQLRVLSPSPALRSKSKNAKDVPRKAAVLMLLYR